MKRENIIDKNIKKSLSNFQLIINNINDKIKDNYEGNKNEIELEVKQFKEKMISFLSVFASSFFLKKYLSNLIMFTNKFRNESTQISDNIAMAETFYTHSNYKEGIEVLIELLQNIKKTAKKNNIYVI
jgi:soluble cytochrome b562